MQKRKILFVSNEYAVGGSSVSLKSLIVGMRKVLPSGVEIVVAVPWNWPGKKFAKAFFEAEGIQCKEFLYRNNYKRLGQKKTWAIWVKELLNRWVVAPLCKYIKREGFQVVCSNSSGVDVGAKAAEKAGAFHAYYVREFMEEDHGIEYLNPEEMQLLLERANRVFFISKAIEEKYKSKYEMHETAQFYDGFVLEDYYLPGRFVLRDDVLHLVQLGRLDDGKGALDSVEIMKVLKDSGIERFRLEFYGAGKPEYEQKMRDRIRQYHMEEQIAIFPFAPNVKEKLGEADVLLMNSRAEGFGRVTVEGMLAGCLALGRRNAGTAELIRHGENGLLYDNISQAVELIKDIVQCPDKYRKIACNGQAWAVEEFDCENTAEKFCRLMFETK